MINNILKEVNKLGDLLEIKNDTIEFVKYIAHEKLLAYSSLDRDKLDEMIEDGRYEEVIIKLQSVIEELEGGYCRILDKIEGHC
jgi:hypothetical protein